jgi:hypothetical protein
MLICVVGAKITSASGPLIQLLTAIQDLLTCASIMLIIRMSEAAHKRFAVLGCAPIVFYSLVLGIWRLLEANLALTLQLIVLAVAVPIFAPLQSRLGRGRVPLLGVLLGLTLLARLDLIFFVLTVLAYELLDSAQIPEVAARIKAVVLQGMIITAEMLPYLLWNWHRFHHLEPISGAIKSTFPHFRPFHIDSFAYPVVAAILLNGCLLWKKKRDSFDTLCILTAIAALLHLGYTLSFGGLSPWYLTTGYLSVSLCVIWLGDRALTQLPFLGRIEPAIILVVFICFLTLASLRLFSNFSYSRLMQGDVAFSGSYVEPKRALAEKLRETLPAGSRIFIFDAPGGVAYYSGMSIMPADGLVSDFSYNTDLVHEGFKMYAARNHIDYFIAPYVNDGQTYDRLFLTMQRAGTSQIIHVEAPLGSRDAGMVSLPDANLLFRFREVNPDLEEIFPELGVWQIQD